MTELKNIGFDSNVLADYNARIAASGHLFIMDEKDDSNDEYAHFYFTGPYEGRKVVYDAVMYTLRLQHESELFEMAEHQAAQNFPNYKKITYDEDENGNLEMLDSEEEEIGLFMAEVMMELEKDERVKVKEHIDIDEHTDFGVALDIGLHVDKITSKIIDKFVKGFREGTIELDPTLYSFQTKGETA